MNTTVKKQRNSSVELLRIISMLLIIILHFMSRKYGIFGADNSLAGQENIMSELIMYNIGRLGVPMFIFISGYYGVKYRLDRMWEMIAMCAIYATISYVGCHAIGEPSTRSHIIAFMNNWWFAAAYVTLYMLSPGLNYLVEYTSKWHLMMIIGVMTYVDFFTLYNQCFDFGGCYTMITLFLTARWTRLYVKREWFKYMPLIFVVAFSIRIAGVALFVSCKQIDHMWVWNSRTSPLTTIIVASCFISITQIHFSSKLINRLAGTSFAVYLLSESRFGMQVFLPLFGEGEFSVIRYLIGAIAVYLIITLIDKIRQPLTEYFIVNRIQKK